MADNIWKDNKCNGDVYTKSNTAGIKANNNVRFTHPINKKKVSNQVNGTGDTSVTGAENGFSIGMRRNIALMGLSSNNKKQLWVRRWREYGAKHVDQYDNRQRKHQFQVFQV